MFFGIVKSIFSSFLKTASFSFILNIFDWSTSFTRSTDLRVILLTSQLFHSSIVHGRDHDHGIFILRILKILKVCRYCHDQREANPLVMVAIGEGMYERQWLFRGYFHAVSPSSHRLYTTVMVVSHGFLNLQYILSTVNHVVSSPSW